MKFGKILSLYLFFFICFSANSAKVNLRAHNHVQNSNNMMDFKDTSNNIQPSTDKKMEDIIHAKSTTVISKSNENTRFKESESLESINIIEKVEKNMETPVMIRKSSGDISYQDVRHRVAMDTAQTVTNNDAFNAIYKDHNDYYTDKKYVIFDNNFQKMEDYLLGEFSNSISSQLVLDKNLVHVDDYKTRSKLNANLSNAPQITKYQVGNSLQSKQYGFDVKGANTFVSNPYNQIFPSNRKF